MKLIFTLCACLIASPLAACPTIVDKTGAKDALYADVAGAKNFQASRTAVNALWDYWFKAPDKQAQEWLNEGVARIRQADLAKAEQILKDLVNYCPTYAEGYNQLAFAQFLAEDFDASGANLRKTLELEPKHVGALSGLGLIAQREGNLAAAKIWIAKAVELHPFLNERFILDLPEDTDEL